MKKAKIQFKYPNDMDSAKKVCQKICDSFEVEISFDDRFDNFGTTWNQCVCHSSIECAKFNPWNHDLLIIAVLHELGHLNDDKERSKVMSLGESDEFKYHKNIYSRELSAWNWAIDKFMELFGRNISIKQGRYISYCLESYLPNYNDFNCDSNNTNWFEEKNGRFWCPIKKKVLR